MRFNINNPLLSSLGAECEKCGRILKYFIDPHQAFSADKVIPPSILIEAKGLAILTVVKAGFVGSARFGSGLIIARKPDGSWSAPSAIATAGLGFGGQLGFEITDFVFILNDDEAVKTLAQAGSITLGGNVSVAAGPVGRNAEAAGAASLKAVAAVFSYSRTRGLFAGVSLEGSVIIERRDANEKLYGHRYRALELLRGNVEPPPQADPLLNILRSPMFGGGGVTASGGLGLSEHGPPTYESSYDDGVWNDQREPAQGEGLSSSNMNRPSPSVFAGTSRQDSTSNNISSSRARVDSWHGDVDDAHDAHDAHDAPGSSQPPSTSFAKPSEKKTPPPRPTAPKPNMGRKQEAIALYTFEADQAGDLGFAKGDVIEVLKTESKDSWWTGRIGAREGIFPGNYVRMKV